MTVTDPPYGEQSPVSTINLMARTPLADLSMSTRRVGSASTKIERFLGSSVEFVEKNVYDLAAAVGHRRFDLVFSSACSLTTAIRRSCSTASGR